MTSPTPAIPPPLPRGKRPRWKIAALIAVLVIVCLAVPGLAFPFLLNLRKRTADRQQAEATRVLENQTRPLSPDEEQALREFLEKLLVAIKARDDETIEHSVDNETFIHLAIAGLELPAGARDGFAKGLRKSRAGILENLCGMAGKLVGIHVRDGKPAATCRFDIPQGGTNYIDLVVRRDAAGFRVIDLHNYLFALDASAEARRAFVAMVPADSESVARMLGLPGKIDRQAVNDIARISNHLRAGQYDEVIAAYEGLPEETRRLPFLYAIYIQALQQTDDDSETANAKYAEALAEGPAILGKKSAIDLLLVDMHFLREDFAAARKCAERTKEIIGNDAYLEFLIGMMALKQGDTAAAKEALLRGEALEPELDAIKDLRVMLEEAETTDPTEPAPATPPDS
jgi:tetratricopeptide (TPR) repeat protein